MFRAFGMFVLSLCTSVAPLWCMRQIDSVVVAYESYHTLKRVDYLNPLEMYSRSKTSYVNYITVTDSVEMRELAIAPTRSYVSGDSCIAGSRIAVRVFYGDGTEDVYGIVGTTLWYNGRCGTISLLTLVTVLVHLPKEYLLEICCFDRVKR